MSIEELRGLDGEIVTSEQFDEIELSEYVTRIDNVGLSGLHDGYVWHTVSLFDGSEIDVYVEM